MSTILPRLKLPDGVSVYPYEPSRVAPTVFYVLVALSSAYHLFQVRHFKFGKVMGLFPWAGTIYTASFVMRMVSTYHKNDLGIYIAAVVLEFAAPPIYAAVNYFVLGRLLHYIPYLSPLHPGRVVTTLVALDTLVEIISASGASRVANYKDPNQQKLGTALIRTALIMLTLLYFAFIYLQIFFHRRCIRHKVDSPKLRGTMYVLYVSCALVQIRNAYRIVDSFLGKKGYTQRHEWCLFVFEATPMLLNSILFNVFHPAFFLPNNNKVYLAKDGSERTGPGWEDKRGRLMTYVDPFDIKGIMNKTDSKNRYWEHDEEWPMVEHQESIAATPDLSSEKVLLDKVADPLDISRRMVKRQALGKITGPGA